VIICFVRYTFGPSLPVPNQPEQKKCVACEAINPNLSEEEKAAINAAQSAASNKVLFCLYTTQ